MRISAEQKKNIVLYLLEKIERKEPEISKAVSETFHINQNTAHTYINELVDAGVICRVKRGEYELLSQTAHYRLERNKGALDTDTYAYDHCLSKHIASLPQNVQEIWCYAFSEMINNVMDHSQAQNADLLIEQNYLNTRVSIWDDGIGIFAKISEYFGYPSLDDAVSELFKGKLTTDSENHSGEGIFFTSKMMDEFYIISDGKLFTANKYNDSQISDWFAQKPSGTRVVMTLSNFSNRTPSEIFDLYASVDGGFTKTRIPLKNIFDSSPVSRSQAKRIANRLNQFEEVTLDFSDLQWMGQGFAHQLFVVFAKEHPNTRLIPVNMSERVAKMYRHVTATS